MRILYQFPVSHFCEKVRWALDFKGLDYQCKNLLPGFHVKTAKKIAKRSSLPILVDDDKVVQSSSEIITYLDHRYPAKSLTPESSDIAADALLWEHKLDESIGVAGRTLVYHHLIDHPDIMLPILTHGQSMVKKVGLKMIYPKLSAMMRQAMNINAESARKAEHKLFTAIDDVNAHLEIMPHLIGDHFTRIDLTVASLLAPFWQLNAYGIDWPAMQQYPGEYQALCHRIQLKTPWIETFYQTYR